MPINVKRHRRSLMTAALFSAVIASPVHALDRASVQRTTPDQLTLAWTSKEPVDVYMTEDPTAPVTAANLVSAKDADGKFEFGSVGSSRPYFLLRNNVTGKEIVLAERLLPLEQGSNFRDVGGYAGADGKTLRWGKIYRSGALPMLSDRDYKLLGGLNIQSIIDLRSLDEREVAPTVLDDKTGAMFIANDYPLKPLMEDFAKAGSNNMYAGMEKTFAPQYRAIFKRLLANEGAVMYHCSAGQDRTGVATALVLTALGVDRATILTDYHLSTPSRRPQWEMPKVDPADYPGNLIVQYYAAAAKKPGGAKAEPLYGADGQSHLVKFFAHIEQKYGSVEAYLDSELGIDAIAITKLRSIYLE